MGRPGHHPPPGVRRAASGARARKVEGVLTDVDAPAPFRRRAGLLLRDAAVVTLFALTTALVIGAVSGDGRPVAVPADLTVPLRPVGPVTAAWADLAALRVLPARVHAGGYDRGCGRGHGCVFGPAWSDDVDVADGHNGVDTRTDVIRRDRGGRTALLDPYSGRPTRTIQIDHLVPLAAAWDLGARGWPPRERADFANDPRELLSVSAAENQLKSDETPGDWADCLRSPGPCLRARPAVWLPRAGIRCALAQRYVLVCRVYALPVTADDHRSLSDMLATCSG